MSDGSDIERKGGKNSIRPLKAASSSENADGSSPITPPQSTSNQLIASHEDSSESEDEEIIQVLPPGRRLRRILSDGESGDIEVSDLFTDTSDDTSGDEDHPKSGVTTGTVEQEGALHDSSSDSDGQSDKCPICLNKISLQEIGTPESCDHCFCVDCIQEWSKNVNTCPVDRQPFTLILVRDHLDGKVTRQIPVNSPTERPEQEAGDVTFCEVCGQSDREDRMLLCDACDLGYHMECLQPPLHYVPIDEWYCPDCTPSRDMVDHIAMVTIEAAGEAMVRAYERRQRTRARPAPRLLPRTSQSERVQSSLRRHRPNQASSSRGMLFGERTQNATTKKRKVNKRKTKRQQKTRIKRIYTDDGVVEVLVKKKKKYGKKRSNRTLSAKSKSVKGRLASRLGMCAPRFKKQFLPETQNRSEETSTSIQHQRSQASIPTLDIFGRRDQLEYFSGSDDEEGDIEGGGVGLMSRVSVARPRDRLISLKKAASVMSVNSSRKPVKLESVSSPASGNLLDSILDSQTLWHSNKAEIKSKPDGSVQAILPKSNSNKVVKEKSKIDVRNTNAPVVETPLFPGAANSGNFKSSSFSATNNSQGENRSTTEQCDGSQEVSSGRTEPSTSTSGSGSNNSSGGGPSPLRGIAPIRFRMNAPPKRPNIHSYPTDNIPPPPLRLKSPATEESFPSTNSPEASPSREDEEIDIYSDIEQEEQKSEEKTFGVLEPPPEPTFLMSMSMDPPPEPPALLMNLNEDASDDEPSGLVIDDLPASDVYDPCAVNSDESSTEEFPLAKPPEIPLALKDPALVADYSSDSFSSPYNPERPTYSGKPIIGCLPRPASHRSSSESEEDCPNFSMYSTTSMNIALRGLPTRESLDIPIPPPLPKQEHRPPSIDIPLPDSDPPSPDKETIDIPVPEDKENEPSTDVEEETTIDKQISNSKDLDQIDEGSVKGDDSDDDTEDEDGYVKKTVVDDKADGEDENDNTDEKKGDVEIGEVDEKDKNGQIKNIKKGLTELADDECSTQGDVLDLAIESEANLENNAPPGSAMECSEIDPSKSPLDLEERDDKAGDGGDKSDGLVDITDEDMSVYDGQENRDDIDKLDEHLLDTSKRSKKDDQSLDSDDDNSLVGGATSAVSGGTLNHSDTVQPPTLPGLEGLETETISESEDVNFDELPIDNDDLTETLRGEEDHLATKKKKKKKTRKISHSEEGVSKTSNEPLEFEEGEIIEDKPKQLAKKDKKLKPKLDNNVEVEEVVESNKPKTPIVEKETLEKKVKKKKEKSLVIKDKTKDIKEKTLKPGQVDENVSWKKLSKSTKERNYRDAKEKEDKSKSNENKEKEESLSKRERRGREKRKEMERYNVRRLISEKPKQPKKDEFGRDISPSKSGSSLSPYRPPRYRSPLRAKNRTRSRSISPRSKSRSRDRKKRSRSRGRVLSRDRTRKARSRDRSRRSLSRNKVSSRSRERRRSPAKKRTDRRRSTSRTRKRTRSRSIHSKRRTSPSLSKSWSPSLSRSSRSRSRYRGKRKSKSRSRSKSVPQSKSNPPKDPPKNLTVIVTNKEALKKKEKKKPAKKKDDRRKRKKGQSPAPSKEVFTSGDNILVSVNFKNSNKNPEVIPATTPLLKESSKRKRDETDGATKKKKPNYTKKTPGAKKSSRLSKINEAAKNAKPVAIIDLDLSPFREQTPSPKEIIVLSDSGDEEDKHHSQNENVNERLGHNGMSQNVMSHSSQQKNSMAQPESPLSSNYMMNSSGPKTPPEPHIKFSITTKPSQLRVLNNPLMDAEEGMHDDNEEADMDEILHKGPNTPPEPPPDLHTPASPPTTPYDPFDPTKSRSSSPQPRNGDTGSLNISREDKLDSAQNDENVDHGNAGELRTSTPPLESDDAKKTPDTVKVHSTPKTDPNNADGSPKVSPPSGTVESNKLSEDLMTKPIQKLLAGASKADITVHKSPDKVITVVINQQAKNQTPKQPIQPMKTTTPNKNQVSKGSTKHQLFSSSIVKQVPILGALLPGLPYVPLNINNNSKSLNRSQQNGDPSDDMDIDPSSPYSPGSSEGDDLFEPPVATPPRNSKPLTKPKNSKFDSLFGSSPANKPKHGRHAAKTSKKGGKLKNKGNKKEEVKVKLDEDQLKILDDLPSSAVEMQVKDKFLKKLNRQERVVEEVKLVLKPHYVKKHVTKEEYKEILRRSVPKICHNKSGEINPIKIQFLVEAYVKKFRYAKKKSSGNVSAPAQTKPKPQKTLWS